MTNLNETLIGPATQSFDKYQSGNFDCSQSNAMVNLTLTPTAPAGTAPPDNNSVVLGSYGGLALNINADSPDTSVDTSVTYWDSARETGQGNQFTNSTIIFFNSAASGVVNQLLGGENVPLSSAVAIPGSGDLGQKFAAVGGSCVHTRNPAAKSMYVEAKIDALTLIVNWVFQPGWQAIIDLKQNQTEYVVRDVILQPGGAPAAFVTSSNDDGPGVVFRSITTAQLMPHLTPKVIDGQTYLYIQ